MRRLLSSSLVVLAAMLCTTSLSAQQVETSQQSPVAEQPKVAEQPDLILHNGKVVSVDRNFSIHQAVAVREGRIWQLGDNEAVLANRGPHTQVVDLGGRMLMPGLIDSHVHPVGAALFEFPDPLPDMDTVADVLAYVKDQASKTEPGTWITLSQVFITRLREQRYPTKAELDEVAPEHPVYFRTGPDAMLNSLALKLNNITSDSEAPSGAKIEKDPMTGEPTGVIRSAGNLIKVGDTGRRGPTQAEGDERLAQLLHDYNSVGITGIIDRGAEEGSLARFHRLRGDQKQTVRLAASYRVDGGANIKAIRERIDELSKHSLRREDPMLRIIGVKVFLDGGMLTGSAYMRQPWGISQIYGISDPEYRGLRYIEDEKLVEMVRATVESGMQFTAHSVGDGAVHALINAYEEVNRTLPIAATRPCVTHSNFMSKEAVETAARLGVVLDIQPAWLYLDSHTLEAQFGYDRLRYFQPLSSIFAAGGLVGGGSDHMQKIGSMRGVNPYNPFLGIWVAVTRTSKYFPRPMHPEEALTREQALRFYTINNAYLMFLEDEVGSLEVGKRADMVVLDRDLLTCEADAIRDCQVVTTYLNGQVVYEQGKSPKSEAPKSE